MATKNPNIFDKIVSFFTGDTENMTSAPHETKDVQEKGIFSNDIGRMFDANGSNADFGIRESRGMTPHEFGGVSFEKDADSAVARFGDRELSFKYSNSIFSNGADSGIHYDGYGSLGDKYSKIITTPFELMEVRNYETGDRFLIQNEITPLNEDGTLVEIKSFRGESLDNMEVSAITVVNFETGWVEEQTLYCDRDGMRETITTNPQDWAGPEYHYFSEAKDEATGRELRAHYDSGGRVEIEASFLPVRDCDTVEYDGDTKIEKSYHNHMTEVLDLYHGRNSNIELQTVTVTEKDGDKEIKKEYDGETHTIESTTISYESDGHTHIEIFKDGELVEQQIDNVTTKFYSEDGTNMQVVNDRDERTISVYEIGVNGESTLLHEYSCDENEHLVSATHYADGEITTERFSTIETVNFRDGEWDSQNKFEHIGEIYNESGELIETKIYDTSYHVSEISFGTLQENPEIRITYETDGDKVVEKHHTRDGYDQEQGQFRYVIETFTISPDGTFEVVSVDKTEMGITIDGEKFYHISSDSTDGVKTDLYETRRASNDTDYKAVKIFTDDNGEKHILTKTEVEVTPFNSDGIENFRFGNDVSITIEKYDTNGEMTNRTVATEKTFATGTSSMDSVEHTEHIYKVYDSDGRLVQETDIKEGYAFDGERVDTTISYDADGSLCTEVRRESNDAITIETTNKYPDGSYTEKIEHSKDIGNDTARVDFVEEREYDSQGKEVSVRTCEYGEPDDNGDRIAIIKETIDGIESERKEVVALEDTTIDNEKPDIETITDEVHDAYNTDVPYDNDYDYGYDYEDYNPTYDDKHEEQEPLKITELDTIPFENSVEVSEVNTISFDGKEFSLSADGEQGTYLKDWECKDGDKEYSIKTITDFDGKERILVYTESEKRDESVSFAENKTEVSTTIEYHYDRDGNCDSKTVTYSYDSKYNEYMEQSSEAKEVIKETYSGDTIVERTEEKTTDRFNQDTGTGDTKSEYVKISYEDGKETKETVTIESEVSHAGIEDCKISKEIVVTNEDGSSTEVSEQYRFVDGEVVVTERIEVDYSTDGDKVETRVIEYGLPDKDGDCICRETTFDSQDDKTDIKKEIVNEKDIPRFEGDLHEAQDYIDSESENDNEDYTDYDSYDNPDE